MRQHSMHSCCTILILNLAQHLGSWSALPELRRLQAAFIDAFSMCLIMSWTSWQLSYQGVEMNNSPDKISCFVVVRWPRNHERLGWAMAEWRLCHLLRECRRIHSPPRLRLLRNLLLWVGHLGPGRGLLPQIYPPASDPDRWFASTSFPLDVPCWDAMGFDSKKFHDHVLLHFGSRMDRVVLLSIGICKNLKATLAYFLWRDIKCESYISLLRYSGVFLPELLIGSLLVC